MSKTIATLFLAAALVSSLPAHGEDLSAADAKNALMMCLTFYQQLKDAGFIKDENLTGTVPVFIVDENQWRRTELKNKAKLGDLTGCLFSGLPGWSQSEFRSNLTNELLGKLNHGRLEAN